MSIVGTNNYLFMTTKELESVKARYKRFRMNGEVPKIEPHRGNGFTVDTYVDCTQLHQTYTKEEIKGLLNSKQFVYKGRIIEKDYNAIADSIKNSGRFAPALTNTFMYDK